MPKFKMRATLSYDYVIDTDEEGYKGATTPQQAAERDMTQSPIEAMLMIAEIGSNETFTITPAEGNGTPEPAVGQVWEDKDPRMAGRQVQITEQLPDDKWRCADVTNPQKTTKLSTEGLKKRWRNVR